MRANRNQNSKTRRRESVAQPRRKHSLVAAGAGAALLMLAVLVYATWEHRSPEQTRPHASPGSLHDSPRQASGPASASAENNAYAGIQACAECHAEQNRTYRQTAHSLALADIAPAEEPPDAAFFHEASGRTYTVYRKGGQFRHKEAVLDENGGEIVSADYPIRYLIGSGRHTRSYLVDIDGFLCESPLTWYASRQRWEMSPGYDTANHRGFERAAESGCLFCHVGRLADDHAYQRLQIVEQAIGCERCHGPGASHVAEQRAIRDGTKPNPTQATIVNPSRLSRELSEAVCAQCHLNTDALALVRGRELVDFRPGMPLTVVCINYCRRESDSKMTVVGHVEQMRLSRCYQESETLTCTTCHDVHSELEPSQKRAYAIQACVKCHTEQACGLALEERLDRPTGNDCVACHMPQVDTEIRHIAFTHHRIGIHSPSPSADDADSSAAVAELVPLDEPEQLSELDRQRNLGMAYYSLALKQTDPETAAVYRERARRLLEAVHAQGGGHREVAAALVRLYRNTDADAALRFAHEALRSGGLAAKSEINCLFFIGEWGLQRGQPRAAQQALEQLTEMRLLSEDWLLLGLCRQQTADLPGAQAALERASKLGPFRFEIHSALAEVYHRLGQQDAAQRERKIAEILAAVQP
jgi:hypothetical protein